MNKGATAHALLAGPAIGETNREHHRSLMYIVLNLRVLFLRAQIVEQRRTQIQRPRAFGIEVPTEIQTQFRHQITRTEVTIGGFFLKIMSPTERKNTVQLDATRFDGWRHKEVDKIDPSIKVNHATGTVALQQVLVRQQEVTFQTEGEGRRKLALDIQDKHPGHQIGIGTVSHRMISTAAEGESPAAFKFRSCCQRPHELRPSG